MPGRIEVLPVPGLPEVGPGDDVAALVVAALAAGPGAGPLRCGDVLVVSSKVVSKAAGLRWEGAGDRDAAVLDQSRRVVAERRSGERVARVVEAAAGPVMAAAGVDGSNTGEDTRPLLLPADPDAAAAALLARAADLVGLPPDDLAVVVSDTAGRAWRSGQTDFALGSAGLTVLDDLRGAKDRDGRPLEVTARAVGDEVAAAADLVKGKADAVPVAVVRGLGDLVRAGAAGAATLVRTGAGDWFSHGTAEAVRSALGVAPGTAAASEVGLASVAPEDVATRVGRAVRVALRDEQGEVSVDVGPGDVRVGGPDRYAVGRVVARLEVALWGERVPARVVDHAVRPVELRLGQEG